MLRKIILALFAIITMVFVSASPVQAQGCAANSCQLSFSASLSISSVLSCNVTRAAMNLGNHFKSENKVSADETTAPRAICQIDPQNGIVDVTFTLPSVLTGPGGATLPITFGTESLRLYDCNNCGQVPQGVNPALPQTKTITSGYLTIAVGENGPNDPAGEVSVDVSHATVAGAYSATILATVALR